MEAGKGIEGKMTMWYTKDMYLDKNKEEVFEWRRYFGPWEYCGKNGIHHQSYEGCPVLCRCVQRFGASQRHLQKNLTFLRRMALMKNWQRPGCGIDLYCGTPFPSLYVYENVSGTRKTCVVRKSFYSKRCPGKRNSGTVQRKRRICGRSHLDKIHAFQKNHWWRHCRRAKLGKSIL